MTEKILALPGLYGIEQLRVDKTVINNGDDVEELQFSYYPKDKKKMKSLLKELIKLL